MKFPLDWYKTLDEVKKNYPKRAVEKKRGSRLGRE